MEDALHIFSDAVEDDPAYKEVKGWILHTTRGRTILPGMHRGRWFSSPDLLHLNLYMRVSQRYIGKQKRDTLEIATIEVEESQRRKLHFTRLLRIMERFADDMNRVLYVENVMPIFLKTSFLNKTDYIMLDPHVSTQICDVDKASSFCFTEFYPVCFYRDPKAKNG